MPTNNPNLTGQARLEMDSQRKAQLQLLLANLKDRLNGMQPNSIIQTQSRKFSEFVPKITDLKLSKGARTIRASWTTPKGMRNFLFYEGQASAVGNFSDAIILRSNEPNMTWGGLQDGVTYGVRVRVVTSQGEVGPWSGGEQEVTIPKGKIIVTNIPGVFTVTYTDNKGAWYPAFPTATTFTDSLPDGVYKSEGGMIMGQLDITGAITYSPGGTIDESGYDQSTIRCLLPTFYGLGMDVIPAGQDAWSPMVKTWLTYQGYTPEQIYSYGVGFAEGYHPFIGRTIFTTFYPTLANTDINFGVNFVYTSPYPAGVSVTVTMTNVKIMEILLEA